jgi:hypothetical protein
MKTSVLPKIVPQYIVDSNGKKTSVILDLKTFSSMIEALEDLHDIIEAENILAKGADEEGHTIEEIEESLK